MNMLVVISPAKKLNETAGTTLPVTEPTFSPRAEALAEEADNEGPSELRVAWAKYKQGVLGFFALLLAFAILSITVEGFLNVWNIISALILLVIIVLTMTVGKFVSDNKSAFIGIMVLIGLFSIGAMNIDGFYSTNNIKSMLLFASFLGLACVGQTLVAMLGGLDLSIPFVIGSANVGMLYLISLGVPPWLALVITLVVGTLIGVINGLLSFRLQGQALILTLGTGFAVSGGIQIITSIGSGAQSMKSGRAAASTSGFTNSSDAVSCACSTETKRTARSGI